MGAPTVNLSTRLGSLELHRTEVINEKVELQKNVEEDEITIADYEEASASLEALHGLSQHQATALYSDLLTSIVQDVMDEHDQGIKLSTRIFRNKPSLTIESEKRGIIEDLVEDRGLSVTNLVAAGLRFVALVQSSYRRFVILDEPECWVEQRLIPRFIGVIERLCDEIGVQAVMISHHSAEYAQSVNTRIVQLVPEAGGIKVHTLNNEIEKEATVSLDEQYREHTSHIDIGIRFIRLQNFQSHTDSYIDLSKGLTVITGANEVGKTAVVRAFRAFRGNGVRRSLCRHDTDVTTISLGLENETVCSWTFNRNSKYGGYAVTQGGDAIETVELPSQQTSETINALLGLSNAELDVHIAHQSDPLFLLNPSISGFKRASLLNLGEEHRLTLEMMNIAAKQKNEVKRRVKLKRERISSINDKLLTYQGLNYVTGLETLAITDAKPHMDAAKAIEILSDNLMDKEGLELTEALVQCAAVEGYAPDVDKAISLLEHESQYDSEALALVEKLANINETQSHESTRAISCVELMANTQRELAHLKKELADLENQLAKEVCRTCGQSLNSQHSKEELTC